MSGLYATDSYPPVNNVSARQAVAIAIDRTSSLETGELETLKRELKACKELLGLIIERMPSQDVVAILNEIGYKWRESRSRTGSNLSLRNLLELRAGPVVEIDYTNWKGVRRVRRIRPLCLECYDKGFHANNYCIRAVDLERAEYTERSFAIKDIHSWKEVV